jgi:hypothetical protein
MFTKPALLTGRVVVIVEVMVVVSPLSFDRPAERRR